MLQNRVITSYSIHYTKLYEVSRDILLPQKSFNPISAILLVADAKNLKRSLAIALQYAEYDIPMLIDINMIDEADARGITIDFDKLSGIIDVDICTSIAREGIGIRKILTKLKRNNFV